MGFFEALLIAFAILMGLNELGREIKKGLIAAATIRRNDSSDAPPKNVE